ncbi:hypothetical protein [Bradyrhizobium sp. LMTR 3]|uniref:hypothetical protein n=1 Tax=Bradyrhizobium sp. LMTR 3 TaxID=189873 RepID=UPI00081067A2|nr:hypothetical protein [Bradyrhizobium sp. LMTR 3]OCK60002.1 hypothetical protein LMTR3_20645 [Bradyrhizobium sp. LMTR 3]
MNSRGSEPHAAMRGPISKLRSKSSGPFGGDMRRAPFAADEVKQLPPIAAEQLGMVAILVNNAIPTLHSLDGGAQWECKARFLLVQRLRRQSYRKAWAGCSIAVPGIGPIAFELYDPNRIVSDRN